MTDANPIRVMIVDDHAVVRSGLATFLKAYPDLQLVGNARSGEEAIKQCGEMHPDVILMDLIMPGLDGASATQAICQSYPDTQVVVLTTFKEESQMQRAMQAGAVGYLLKDVQADDLAEAIRLAHAGQSISSHDAPTHAPEPPDALKNYP